MFSFMRQWMLIEILWCHVNSLAQYFFEQILSLENCKVQVEVPKKENNPRLLIMLPGDPINQPSQSNNSERKYCVPHVPVDKQCLEI